MYLAYKNESELPDFNLIQITKTLENGFTVHSIEKLNKIGNHYGSQETSSFKLYFYHIYFAKSLDYVSM